MLDQFGRNIDYMRISITDRCNLCCTYCRPDRTPYIPHDAVMRYEEYLKICAAASDIGIRKIKVTGGEPLVRKGALDFVRSLKSIPGIEAVTLTTNGVLLTDLADKLVASGADAVNISLDAADRARYQAITGFDQFEAAQRGIFLCESLGIRTKINAVLLPETLDQILPLASYARDWNIDVRFIERMPIGAGKEGAFLSFEKAREQLLKMYPDLHPTKERRGFGPAIYEASDKLKGRIGWIRAISHCFCDQCNRVRITSEGKLKPCLCYDHATDLCALIRNGADHETLKNILQSAIEKKPQAHCFAEKEAVTERRPMSSIGG